MHLISIRYLRTDAAIYPDVTEQIEVWYQVVKDASWQSLQEVRDFQIKKYPKISCGVGVPARLQLKRARMPIPQHGELNFWKSLREIYPSATVFNIKGNAYRLIVDIDYETQTIYYKYFLTHAEYDKEKWKKKPYF